MSARAQKPPLGGRGRGLLFVIGSLDLGGAERHVAQLAPRLKALGWRPTIYCLGRLGRQAQSVEENGVEVVSPPMALSLASGGRLVKALGLALSALKLSLVMAKRRPAIVHFFLPAAYIIGAPLAILARIPVRVMSRRSLNVYQESHPFARRLEPVLHRRMSAILANSERVRRQLIEEEGCDPAHVELIHNGVDTDLFHPAAERAAARRELGLDPHAFVVTVLANLIAYKGHADLLAALATIDADLPGPWLLQCIGRDDGMGGELARLSGQLGLDANVRLMGERADAAAYLAASDLAVLPSHQEGFANAILEAMACGLPVIATNVGGNPEAVVDGETGLIVPPHHPDALARAILELAEDPALARKMGAAGRKRAEARFSLEACVEAYDAFYRGIVPAS